MVKKCPRCKLTKPATEYYKDKHQPSGLSGVCKPCKLIYSQLYLSTARGKEKAKKKHGGVGYNKEWAIKYRQEVVKVRDKNKMKARTILNNAIKMGKLIKPNYCSRCLNECKPEAHHDDYNKPLDVLWVCRSCHRRVHGLGVDLETIGGKL